MQDDHEKDILVAERLWSVAPDGLSEEQLAKLAGIYIHCLLVVLGLTIVAVGRHDNFRAKKLLKGAVFRSLPLIIHKLSGPYSGVAYNHIAAGQVKTMSFEGKDTRVVRNVKSQDDPQGVDIEDRLSIDVGRPQAKARN